MSNAKNIDDMSAKSSKMLKSDSTEMNLADEITKIVNGVGATLTEITTTQNLATGALDFTTSVGSNFTVKGVYFLFSGSVTQTITLTYRSVVLFTEAVTAGATAFIEGDFDILGAEGEELTIECTNNTTPAVTLTVTLDVGVK